MAFKRYGLRTRVIVYNLLPVLLIGLFFTAYYIFNRYNQIEQNIVANGTAVIEPLAQSIEEPLGDNDLDRVLKIINYVHRRNSELIDSIALFDLNGNLLATSKIITDFSILKYSEEMPISGTTNVYFHDDSIILRTPLFSEVMDFSDLSLSTPNYKLGKFDVNPVRLVGYISVKLNKLPAILSLYQDFALSLFVLLVGLILALIFAFNLIKEVVEPIKRMIRAIYSIREGQLDTRITGSTYGELERLRLGINGMAKSISEYHNEMQQNIDQSTADLRETLEQIEIQNVELDLAKKRAQEAARVKTEFLANMSHELRTPLNGILGFTKELFKGKLTSVQYEYLSTIDRSAKNLLSIINNILDFSKLESGKLTFEKIPFRIRDAIDEVLKIIAPVAHEKDVNLSFQIDKNIPELLIGDPLRLQQILINLVSNAVKFTENGSVCIILNKVVTETEENDDIYVEISVKDTGIGISPSQQTKLFQPFIQANNSISRTFGGTGLGLVITHKLITLMGGGITVKSQLGKGSTFSTTLPLKISKLPIEKNTLINKLNGLNVLVVDDNDWSRESCAKMLEDWDMNVFAVASPKTALTLPVQDFFCILWGVKAHSSITQLKNSLDELGNSSSLIFYVNSHDSKYINDLYLFGALDCLVKPFSYSRLIESFEKILFVDSKDVRTDKYENTKINKLNISVLAVDDNLANLKLITMMLEDLVVKVDSCTSGEQAINLCRINCYDLIMMDIQMPIMDGVTAMQEIRKDKLGKCQNIPIVAVTALAIPGEKERLVQLGMDGYLSKPIEDIQLMNLLNRVDSLKGNCNKSNLSIESNSDIEEPKDDFFQTKKCDIRDNELALKQVAGKKDLAKEMLEMFMESVTPTQNMISKLSSFSTEHIIKTVHKLAGGAAYCGMPKIQKLCNTIESNLRKGVSINDIEPECFELDDMLELVKQNIGDWFKDLDD